MQASWLVMHRKSPQQLRVRCVLGTLCSKRAQERHLRLHHPRRSQQKCHHLQSSCKPQQPQAMQLCSLPRWRPSAMRCRRRVLLFAPPRVEGTTNASPCSWLTEQRPTRSLPMGRLPFIWRAGVGMQAWLGGCWWRELRLTSRRVAGRPHYMPRAGQVTTRLPGSLPPPALTRIPPGRMAAAPSWMLPSRGRRPA